MPNSTDRTSLAPEIVITGASISPASGTAQDFTNPVTYTVTAEDGTTQAYTVYVDVYITYEFAAGSNAWWTAFWVKNNTKSLSRVDVKSANHADWFQLTLQGDGSYADAGGFGAGSFTIRLTSTDGQSIEDTYTAFTAGGTLQSTSQFKR